MDPRETTRSGATVLMVTHGTAGDVLPFVVLGRELRRRGHRVVLLSHAPYRTRAAEAGLDFVPVDTEEGYRRHLDRTPQLLAAHGPAELRSFYERGDLFRQTRVEFDTLVANHRPGGTVLVGRHTSALSVLLAAEALRAPAAWVALSPVQFGTSAAAVHNLRFGLATGLATLRAAAGLAPVDDWGGWFDSADLLLGLWPEWFDRAGVRSPGRALLTGFPLADDEPAGGPEAIPAPVRRLLDTEPPVLITGGTGRMVHDQFLEVATEAAVRSGRPALVVAPHASGRGSSRPGVHLVERLPFASVMPRVAAVVHHGGIGTLARALHAGTPQVLLAHGADRPDNAERLARRGLASWLPVEDWSPDRAADLLGAALAAGRTGAVPEPVTATPPSPESTGNVVVPPDGVVRAADAVEQLLRAPQVARSRRLAARLKGLDAAQREVVLARLRERAGGGAVTG